MKTEDQGLLLNLLTERRVLSLGVLVDGRPHVGLLPFVAASDFQSVLVHASQLARHTRGLRSGMPFSILIHGEEAASADALQVPRVTISGTVRVVAPEDHDHEAARRSFIDRFPSSGQTFLLADFSLFRLHFEEGRLVGGFARAVNLGPETFAELTR